MVSTSHLPLALLIVFGSAKLLAETAERLREQADVMQAVAATFTVEVIAEARTPALVA